MHFLCISTVLRDNRDLLHFIIVTIRDNMLPVNHEALRDVISCDLFALDTFLGTLFPDETNFKLLVLLYCQLFPKSGQDDNRL
jgi:hypothetical protein